MSTKFFTVKQVAELFNVREESIRRWVRAGEIKAVKLSGVLRIPEDSLKAFVEANAVE